MIVMSKKSITLRFWKFNINLKYIETYLCVLQLFKYIYAYLKLFMRIIIIQIYLCVVINI
jgi:hypothetical protein